MLGFGEPAIFHANGKIYCRVGSGTKVVEPPSGELARRDGLLAVCVVSALSLVLATLSVVLNVVVTRDSVVAGRGQQTTMGTLCVPCYRRRASNSNESDLESLERLFQSSRSNGRKADEADQQSEDAMCCASDDKQLENLLNVILNEKKAEEEDNAIQRSAAGAGPYPSCDPSSLVSSDGTACLLPASLSLNPTTATAAHLVSRHSPASAADQDAADGNLWLVKWDPHSRRSFCRGLICNSTHLLPSQPGFYFVYSQTSFNLTSSPDESLTHYIKRYNTRYPNGGIDILMQHSSSIRGYSASSASSSTSSTRPAVTDSSFLGGLVRINPKDALYVEVSHSTSLRSLETTTFFGMFKVS